MKIFQTRLLTQLVSSFSALSLLTMGLVAFSAYTKARDALQTEVFGRLNVAVSLKEFQVSQWFEIQQQETLLLARSQIVNNALPDLDAAFPQNSASPFAAAEVPDSINILTRHFNDVLAVKPNIQSIEILRNGIVIFSTDARQQGVYKGLGNNTTYFEHDQTQVIPNIFISPLTQQPNIIFATPILDQSYGYQAVLAITLNLETIDSLVREQASLGQTGATYLVQRVGNRTIFLSGNRTVAAPPSNAFPASPVPPADRSLDIGLDVSSEGIDAAMIGINNERLYRNYNGVPVIGVYQWLDGNNVALFAELSQQEAFQPAVKLAQQIFLVGLSSAGLLVAVVYLIARQIARPVLVITKAAVALAQGSRDQRVDTNSHIIEIGTLARSFNTMAAQIKASFETLEDKVSERTAELANANAQITTLNTQLKAENLRMGAELDVARQIQQMILPKTEELDNIKGLDIAGYMEPAAEVGGDYYDVLEIDGIVTLSIGDVTGHGLESGLLMLMTQTAVRTLQEVRERDPVKFLDTLNRTIYHNVQRMNSDRNLTLAILHYAEGKLSISGQHEETLIVRANGTLERIDTMDLGLPIGLDDDISAFIDHTLVTLQPGDGVVLYTDGIPEAYNPNKKQYGMQRLCDVIRRSWQGSAEDIKRTIIDDVQAFIDHQKVFDDITLLVLKQQ
jgi:sigma-B regulation protein RsbU (phosphoserine phosphatase)